MKVFITRRSIYAVRDRWLILRIVGAMLGVLIILGAVVLALT